jgi:leucyl-tRNA synthetase
VPVFIGDYVSNGYGNGALWRFGTYERDLPLQKNMAFHKRSHHSRWQTAGRAAAGLHRIWHSYRIRQFSGLTSEKAIEKMIAWLEENKLGSGRVNYKMRDWLISRQRYWGARFNNSLRQLR